MSGLLGFLIVAGAGYGFTAGVTIGPFLGYLIKSVLVLGWRRALPIIFVPPIVDTPIIITFVFLLDQLPDVAVDLIRVIGGAFVVYLAYNAWKDYSAGQLLIDPTQNAPDTDNTVGGAFTRGLLVNALNPAPYVFWGTVSGPLLLQGLEVSVWYGAAYLFAFYATFMSLMLGLIFLVHQLGSLGVRAARGALLAAVVLLAVLGASLVGDGVLGITGVL